MKKCVCALLLALLLVLGACGAEETGDGTAAETGEATATASKNVTDTGDGNGTETAEKSEEPSPETGTTVVPDESGMFTDRDLDAGYDENSTVRITLSGTTAEGGDGVTVSGSTVTISQAGVYILSGTLTDGSIVVDAGDNDKVQLVLNGVSVNSNTSAAVYVRQADKVFLTTAEGSQNTLTNDGTFESTDGDNIDAVIFSKDDLTLNGNGSLTVQSTTGHGVTGKDDLVVTGGNYTITSAGHGLEGKDSVRIADGTFIINAGKDGIHAENEDDESLGFVYIAGGTFTIEAEGDGVSAGTTLEIGGGEFTITAGGGASNASLSSSSGYNQYGGGRIGGRSGTFGPGSETGGTDSDDSTSMKGLKGGESVTVLGGRITIDAADDGVHSNGSIQIADGTLTIATGDDGIHADDSLQVKGGTIEISESYEGMEALILEISGGNIELTASDDGLNASGGTDSSGIGGRDGMFGGGMGGSSNEGSVVISGGDLYIQAGGDGIDANGSLEMTGGYVVICGPTSGDTSTLDYNTSAVISGGTFIGTGASTMAQTFSENTQGVLAIQFNAQQAGTEVIVRDGAGQEILSYQPELSFAVFIYSSPEIVSGEDYTVIVGSLDGAVTAY